MAKLDTDEFDAQILAENVTFLNDCFDNTFVLANSLPCVREYVAETEPEPSLNKIKVLKNNSTCSPSSRTSQLENSIHQSRISTQCKDNSRYLKNWGLPGEIIQRYEEKGITQMFEWQVSCLGNSKVLADNSNLVYSAPTSAGKTLVAEILTIKTILERQKKVIIILPFVSIVREKMFYLQDILSSSGIRVEGFMGSQSPPGGLQAVHIAICTIEKANSLLNRLLDENNISELGAIIVDELHLLGDPNRGYILELLLTKVKYISSRLDIQIQIVGMSATLPNLDELAKWLDAELFITEFRPIPLNEVCLIGNKFYDKHGNYIKNVDHIDCTGEKDNILNICLDTIKDGCSVLIFCMTKNRCENLAQNIATSFNKLGCSAAQSGLILRQQLKSESIFEVLEQLKNCPVGLDQILKQVISFGVAYHHAGLTFDERDIIEGAFKSGALRVLVATSTLSSGVNLPARKVIIRSPMFQRQPINNLTYKQMVGRAGRMGKDTSGESVLICTEAERKIGLELMTSALDPVRSCIDNEDKYMRSMLEIIASEDVCTKAELELYSKCTLLYAQKLLSNNLLLEDTLKELVNFELIRNQTESTEESYVATGLGKACLSSSMAPHDGLSLFCELQKARQCLVLETDLHLIYLVTPYSVSNQWSDIDWLHLLTLWESLTKAMKRVGELVGVQESFIIRSLRGTRNSNVCPKSLNIHKRFYTALALQDLVNEVPLSQVATKFQCARGFLQGLQQAAATFAGMVTAFCRQLGWKNMETLISQFQDRLHFGIHSELIELIKLPSLNSTRARALFDAGFENISKIASADINVIENIFHKAVPFQSEKKRDDDDDLDFRKRNSIKNIWITGCCGMTPRQAANVLILEARNYLKQEIGVTEIMWNKEVDSNIVVDDILQKSHSNGTNHVDNNECSKQECNYDVNEKVNIESNASDLVITDSDKSNDINSFKKSISEKEVETVLNNEVIEEKVHKSSFTKDSTNKTNIKNEKQITFPHILLESNNSSPQTLIKDEILWDSLSFTASAMQNISKGPPSGTFFSPNISFGETEVKLEEPSSATKNASKSSYTSNKDVSLFSTDAENSFVEESFSVKSDTEVLDTKIKGNGQIKPEDNNTVDYINSSTILNAFKSSVIENDDDDDIKLMYEEEHDIFDELPINGTCLDNEVVNTQHNGSIIVKNSFISPLKRLSIDNGDMCQSSVKKRKKINEVVSQSKCMNLQSLCCKDSTHVVMKFTNHILDCYMLRENDVLKIENLFQSHNFVSMIVEIGVATPTKSKLIGSNILKNGRGCEVIPIDNPTKLLMKAITICFSEKLCVYLDLTSVEGILHLIKSVLSKWLDNKSINIRVISIKSWYAKMQEYFQKEILSHFCDVALREWLIDSDTRISNIFDLAMKYCNLDLPNMELKVNEQNKRFKDLSPAQNMCLKGWCILKVAEQQEITLLQQYNLNSTINELEDIETHVLKILANSERRGITVDKTLASHLLIDVKKSQEILQMKAYKMCGYHFNFNSSKSVAKVLGLYKGRKISTKKSVLTAHSSPLASIVIFWRKLNSILTKTLYPLTEKACVYSSDNRNVFKAASGCVFVSADYCQLEMRILTHYSTDPMLMDIMSSDVDVFKSIASTWSGVKEEEVDEDLRQKAKQLCYGIIYGMGNKTLAQHLDVTEAEAAVFMDTFYKTYPAIKVFTRNVLEDCRKTGYVETLKKRRRYLPDINHHLGAKRSAAERQAINTMIQGSAADIAKAAMYAIDKRTNNNPNKPSLVLQMHDELIYEVPEYDKLSFITTIKEIMEEAIHLKVPLPVKVKAGYSWGCLEEVKTT
ncbi:DNA polymerase theta isoform X2 [Epargyreus clarus]|uniref:DNA polymerase theta isoform X2 n=1 Tax=Epargyreus clarus TaxID=520877 RepID=UPI003C2F1514